MAQAVSRRPVTEEARVHSSVSLCRFCGRQRGNGHVFCRYNSTVALHTHISSGGLTKGPFVATVQRHSLMPSI
jgi:hypothetical protein